LQALAPQLARYLIDGRQLLPTVRSPGGPEEEHHHLSAQVGEVSFLAVEVRQAEGGRWLRRLVRNDLHRSEIGGRERGRGDDSGRHAEHQGRQCFHDAPDPLSAASTSSALSRLSGLSMTLMYLTVPVLSMMKYARLA